MAGGLKMESPPYRGVKRASGQGAPRVSTALLASSQSFRAAVAAAASVCENRGLMQEGVVVDLLDEEIRHVGTRDEPAHPVARIDQGAIGVRLWPIGQDHGAHDHPVELAIADDAFLHILVVIDVAQQQM
jgi:hypothetical protein